MVNPDILILERFCLDITLCGATGVFSVFEEENDIFYYFVNI